ncbi:hypothetical protein LJR230_005120 [Trinickia sp. LjRoot230]|uniref:hypothetical protein n=1 Tax=Trinickia sp. LjRoot230 TaxID=3342288 RepID=UPI003ECF9C4C
MFSALRALRNTGNDSSVAASVESRGSDARPVRANLPLPLADLRSVIEAATPPRKLQVRLSGLPKPQEAHVMNSRGQRRRLNEVRRAAKEHGVPLSKAQARRLAKKTEEPDTENDESSDDQPQQDCCALGDRLRDLLSLGLPKVITA